jgi:ankyrin
VEVAGNMVPVTKTNEPISISFRPFRENRLPLVVRIKDIRSEPAGQVIFLADRLRAPAAASGDVVKPPAPICVLNVVLPGVTVGTDIQTPELEAKEFAESIALAAAGS